MENNNLVTYKNKINKSLGKKNSGKTLDYDEANELILDYIKAQNLERMNDSKDKKSFVTKEDLRKKLQETRKDVVDCILKENISIRGYTGEKIKDFIEEMVDEHGGYSILSDAFSDDEVSDIFCLDYKTIYLEKAGENVLYEKQFKNKKHYQAIVERFIGYTGKQLNTGDSPIVDFELFQDRGCATSTKVTPRDISLTIRKHAEDHIILEQLLCWKCLSEELAEFLGIIIDGEGNLVIGGITGSGKTTTLRALLDYYVNKNKKRMILCEDTQELFPKNDHTLELVSVKSDNPKNSVSLSQIIITALRLKPKYIVVGEVRGKEALDAVEGGETGHSTIFSMHGKEPINIINRLVTKYLTAMPALGIDVVERIVGSAIDYIAMQDDIPNTGRKVTIISEVTFDYEKQRIKLKPIFKYDFKHKDFILINRMNPEKADNLLRRGIPFERIEPWLDSGDPELEKEFISKFNEKYLKESKNRIEGYKKKLEDIKIEKEKNIDIELQKYEEEKEMLLNVAMSNEEQKEKENKENIDIINKKGFNGF